MQDNLSSYRIRTPSHTTWHWIVVLVVWLHFDAYPYPIFEQKLCGERILCRTFSHGWKTWVILVAVPLSMSIVLWIVFIYIFLSLMAFLVPLCVWQNNALEVLVKIFYPNSHKVGTTDWIWICYGEWIFAKNRRMKKNKRMAKNMEKLLRK